MVGFKHEEVSFHHRVKAFQWVAQIHRLIVFVAFQVVVQRDFHRHGIVLDFKGFPVLADADVVNGQQARQLLFQLRTAFQYAFLRDSISGKGRVLRHTVGQGDGNAGVGVGQLGNIFLPHSIKLYVIDTGGSGVFTVL